MWFPIDVCFLSDQLQVLAVRPLLRPWNQARGPRGSRSTLELPPGLLARTATQVGDRLQISKSEPQGE